MVARESRSRVLEKGLGMESRHILTRTNQEGETKIFFVLYGTFGKSVNSSDLDACLMYMKVTSSERKDLEAELYSGGSFYILAEVQGNGIELREIDSNGLCKLVPGERLVPHKEIGLLYDVLGGDFDKHQNVFRVYVENKVDLLAKFGYHPSSGSFVLPTRCDISTVLELNVIPSLARETKDTYLLLWQYLLGSKLHAKSDQNHYFVGQKLAHRLQEIEIGNVKEWQGFFKSVGLTMWEVEARKHRLERFAKKIDNKIKVFGETREGRLLLENYIKTIVKELDLALELWAWYSWDQLGPEEEYHHLLTVADILFTLTAQLGKPGNWPADAEYF
jgi:hypothetical protein